jgi:antitoxin (DNA-binding transcriptional repressor) of toxin-antitoxin stability system
MTTRPSRKRPAAPKPVLPPEPAVPSRGRYEVTDAVPGRIAETPPSWAAAPATTVVSATEAARRFSDLVSRACYQGETFVIERGGRPICQLGPLDVRLCTGADLLTLLSRLPRPDEQFLAAVEAASREQAPVEPSPWER